MRLRSNFVAAEPPGTEDQVQRAGNRGMSGKRSGNSSAARWRRPRPALRHGLRKRGLAEGQGTQKMENNTPDQPDSLRWNQFVLGPEFVKAFPSWQRVVLGHTWCVTAHPNLNICQQGQNDNWIALLGFILDPENPEATDTEIIENLLSMISAFSYFLECIDRFGGRWVIVLYDGLSTKLFHDACGSRQVFHTDGNLPLWCASEPELIADIMRLEVDQEADDFITLQLARRSLEGWWPGDSSPYKEIHHLLPNHYLDLATAHPHRYWPRHKLPSVLLNDGVKSVGRILRGVMKAASLRFDLSLSVSAGYDSRCLLAASHEIIDQLSFNTVEQIHDYWSNFVDVTIAGRLLTKLGLRLDLVKETTAIDRSFFEKYMQSSKYPHVYYYPEVQAFYQLYKRQKVEVTGHASEIGRCYYGTSFTNLKNAGKALASKTRMGWQPFAIRHFQSWYDRLEDTKGIHPLDLFFWENKLGNWLEMAHAEIDIRSRDIVMPFNCRDLLVKMLGVKEAYRCGPLYVFHKKLIGSLWADLLSEPINQLEPPSLKARARSRLSAAKQSVRRVKASIAGLGR